MGESLFYSWLRHVKECQIVQTNWKVSPQWERQHEDELNNIMKVADEHFRKKYGYKIFKKNSSLSQIVRQGECDALGISVQNGENRFYAVDVAFHSEGLNYGTREETVMKVIAKSIRTAMCLYGYMQSKNAELIFASPKINPSILNDLLPCVEDINSLLIEQGFDFKVRIIANDEFDSSVLQPILLLSDGIADTSELFVRSYQMFTMFASDKQNRFPRRIVGKTTHSDDIDCTDDRPPKKMVCKTVQANAVDYQDSNVYKELKIGKLANVVLRRMLEDGLASEDEVELMQQSEYSKANFHLNYPLLARYSGCKKERYYKLPLTIRGKQYVMCSEWFETEANNDRPYLEKWIYSHSNR